MSQVITQDQQKKKSKQRQRFTLVATCFDKKGNVIGTGVNEYHRSHPLMKYFAEKAGESEHKVWKHAELSAVLASGKKEIDSILVQRFHKNGLMANAKPCKTCQEMLKAFGVKLVKYTHEEGIKEYVV